MQFTVNANLRCARNGDEKAYKALKKRLKTALLKQLDSEINARQEELKPYAVSALVNKLSRQLLDRDSNWVDKIDFCSLVAEQMPSTLREFVGFTPNKKSEKSGDYIDFSIWDKSVQALAKKDKALAKILRLYYLGGMSYEGIASATQLTVAEVDRRLRFARAWVSRDMLASL